MAHPPSAGILLYRGTANGIEVFIAHMGGPFWVRKDARAWSIPKGEFQPGESAPDAARREFSEEIGVPVPDGDLEELGVFRYSSGKTVTVFAIDAPGFELAELVSNTFEVEWPPRSGRMRAFPELDDARWVPLDDARDKLVAGQVPALDALARRLPH
ncbi:MAG: mismatch repair protein MutT [Schumannella sp.]|nr:mismatch repair protein MutT [Schumannella sp.]